MATGTWICADCRSANNAKQGRCYKCRVPRSTGELTEASVAMTAAQVIGAQTVLVRANRLGARYRPTWPIAILLVPVILAAMALSSAESAASMALVNVDGQIVDDPILTQNLARMSLWASLAFLLGVVIWSFWIAFVVANVPALTARWPAHGPLGAFAAQWLPIRNIKRPHTVVRGVLAILSEGRSGPRLIALAWWATLLASYVAPTFVLLLRGSESILQAVIMAVRVQMVLTLLAGIFAIAVVVIVEREQRAALDRRARVLLGGSIQSGGPSPEAAQPAS